jgi:hypothetical protein
MSAPGSYLASRLTGIPTVLTARRHVSKISMKRS